MTTKRTTHRSTKGTKLYAVRSTKRATRGEFRDIQTHRRASAADQRKRSKAEGTWWRWAVVFAEGGIHLFDTRKQARGWRSEWNGRPHLKIVRVPILVGMPDPLRKRRG